MQGAITPPPGFARAAPPGRQAYLSGALRASQRGVGGLSGAGGGGGRRWGRRCADCRGGTQDRIYRPMLVACGVRRPPGVWGSGCAWAGGSPVYFQLPTSVVCAFQKDARRQEDMTILCQAAAGQASGPALPCTAEAAQSCWRLESDAGIEAEPRDAADLPGERHWRPPPLPLGAAAAAAATAIAGLAVAAATWRWACHCHGQPSTCTQVRVAIASFACGGPPGSGLVPGGPQAARQQRCQARQRTSLRPCQHTTPTGSLGIWPPMRRTLCAAAACGPCRLGGHSHLTTNAAASASTWRDLQKAAHDYGRDLFSVISRCRCFS